MLKDDTYVIVVEHDLSVLDYLSDFICCLYGKPGAYGVVTMPFSVREGINIFLAGLNADGELGVSATKRSHSRLPPKKASRVAITRTPIRVSSLGEDAGRFHAQRRGW